MLERLEKAICVLGLLFTMQAIFPLLYPPGTPHSQVIGISLQVLIYGGVLLFCFIRWKELALQSCSLTWILILMIIVLISTLWSQYHSLSLRRGLILSATTLFGVYFASRFSIAQQFRMLATAFGIIQILSIAFALFLPEYGLDHTLHSGAWQGVFHQKNELGRNMVMASILFLFGGDAINRVCRWLGVLLALSLLFMSHSVGGIGVLTVTLCCLSALPLLRARLTVSVPILVTAFLIIGTAGVACYVNKSDVLALIHRSDTLTGRTLIWGAVLPEMSQSPILGYGYDAFWLGSIGASGDVTASIGFAPKHAHNGFLDVWLELGALGFLTFAVSYLSQVRKALQRYRHDNSVFGTWPIAFLLMMLVYNTVESSLLRENSIIWVLYTANAINLAYYHVRATDHEVAGKEASYVALCTCLPE